MFVFIGSPGSGKSTQAKLLAEKLKCPYLSVGQMLRQKFPSGSYHKQLDAGDILPADIVNPLIEAKLAKLIPGQWVVLDGLLRTGQDGELLKSWLKSDKIKNPVIIHLFIDESLAQKRLMGRGRADDASEVIKHRFEEYKNQSLPVLADLKKAGFTVHDVDASGSVEEVSARIQQLLGEVG